MAIELRPDQYSRTQPDPSPREKLHRSDGRESDGSTRRVASKDEARAKQSQPPVVVDIRSERNKIQDNSRRETASEKIAHYTKKQVLARSKVSRTKAPVPGSEPSANKNGETRQR